MKVIPIRPDTPDALLMMEELSKDLESITGSSGRNSFDSNDVLVPRSLFVVAYNEDEEAIGCGALRPIDEDIAEVKRMFSKTKANGVGSEILNYLEIEAGKLGYQTLWLETRLINKRAVSFYENRGYHRINNYGKYVNNPEAVCFEKNIK
jgi:N-acetylglutamate synthase and related acetyltransferases